MKCTNKNHSLPKFLAEFTGEDLAGTTYEQLIPWFLPAENLEKAFRVIIGDFVTTEDGTGIVTLRQLSVQMIIELLKKRNSANVGKR